MMRSKIISRRLVEGNYVYKNKLFPKNSKIYAYQLSMNYLIEVNKNYFFIKKLI